MQQYKKNGNYTKSYIDMMKKYYKRYLESNTKYLHQCYVKPSTAKLNAMDKIHYKSEGTPYIISYNTSYFTVAYFTTEDELKYFCVDTGRNTYVILATFL